MDMSQRPDGHCKSREEAGGVSSECDWRRTVKFDETDVELKKVGICIVPRHGETKIGCG